MKLSKNLREIVLAIGIILIVLRLFFPVKEYQVFSENIRYKYSSINDERKNRIEKTVVVSKTIFQVFGIAFLVGGFFLINKLNNEKET